MFRSALYLILVPLICNWVNGCAFGGESITARREAITETAKLYLESSSGYSDGDLITDSQIEELQHYLLVSHGKSPATHGGLSNRAVKDRAPLARFFNGEKGAAELLRAAAKELGGYAEIDALSHHRDGREALSRAIANESTAEIVTAVESARNPTNKPERNENSSSGRELKGIYTLDDFLEAAFPDGSKNEPQRGESLQQ